MSHVWPAERNDFERRFGVTYCRRCGRLVAIDKKPGWKQTRWCRVVRILTRRSLRK